HLEHTELADCPEAVLDGADDTMGVVPLTFEIEHRIDDMLERLGPGQTPVFRHVSHYECRNVLAFCGEQQLSGGFADLSDAARWGLELEGVDRLHRIDDDHHRLDSGDFLENSLETGLGQEIEGRVANGQPLPARALI